MIASTGVSSARPSLSAFKTSRVERTPTARPWRSTTGNADTFDSTSSATASAMVASVLIVLRPVCISSATFMDPPLVSLEHSDRPFGRVGEGVTDERICPRFYQPRLEDRATTHRHRDRLHALERMSERAVQVAAV